MNSHHAILQNAEEIKITVVVINIVSALYSPIIEKICRTPVKFRQKLRQ